MRGKRRSPGSAVGYRISSAPALPGEARMSEIATLRVRAEGMAQEHRWDTLARETNGRKVRPNAPDEHLFLSYERHGLSVCGVQDIIETYTSHAGITKKVRAHSPRRASATHKPRQGIPAFQ